jgi:hypothetical protein
MKNLTTFAIGDEFYRAARTTTSTITHLPEAPSALNFEFGSLSATRHENAQRQLCMAK